MVTYPGFGQSREVWKGQLDLAGRQGVSGRRQHLWGYAMINSEQLTLQVVRECQEKGNICGGCALINSEQLDLAGRQELERYCIWRRVIMLSRRWQKVSRKRSKNMSFHDVKK